MNLPKCWQTTSQTQSLKETIDNDPWNKKLKIAMEKYSITEENIAGKRNKQVKQIVKLKVNNHIKETIIANRANKSKVKHILDHDGYKQKRNMEGTYMLTMSKALHVHVLYLQ